VKQVNFKPRLKQEAQLLQR